eukprot:ANDGO_02800.mRNA.1 Syntaxin-61
MAAQDPFYLVKDEVESGSQSAKKLYERFQSLVESGNTSGNPEYERISVDLKKQLKTVELDLGDLDEAMTIVESNRVKFNISDDEVKKRKSFIAEKKKMIREMNDVLLKQTSQKRNALMGAKGAAGAGAGALGGAMTDDDRMDRLGVQDNERFVRGEVQRQEQIIRDQDQDLDELHGAVSRISQIGNQIHDELNTQKVMIDELDRNVESTSSRLKANMRKAAKVLKDAQDKGKICCIILLCAVLLGLLILLFRLGK